MIRLFIAAIYVALIFSLAGCVETRHVDINDIKMGDIALPDPNQESRVAKNIRIDCIQYEIPLEKYELLNGVWPMLSDENLYFNSKQAFTANAFVLGFGKYEIWKDIEEHIQMAKAKKIKTTTLLFSSEEELDIKVTFLKNPMEILYLDTDYSIQSVNTTQGQLDLRIKVKKPENKQDTCNLYGKIVHIPHENLLLELPSNIKSPEFVFKVTGFGAKISQGDFLFFAPGRYMGDSKSLTNVFFNKPGKKPQIKFFILFCSGIID